jgi:hypothetical protein
VVVLPGALSNTTTSCWLAAAAMICQSTWNSESWKVVEVAASASAEIALSTRDSTDATGAPAVSASATDTSPSPVADTRTRTFDAPTACSETPDQANGSAAPLTPVSATVCRAESSNAGCRPKFSASAPSARVASA